jgi:hypothetical protein
MGSLWSKSAKFFAEFHWGWTKGWLSASANWVKNEKGTDKRTESFLKNGRNMKE